LSPPRPPRVSGLRRFGGVSFAYFAAIGLFNPYAPLWFQSLGLSTLVIGGIASLQSWTRIVAPYAWSWAGDHSGRRTELIRLAAVGALLSALGLLGVRGAVPVALVTTLLFVANSGVVPLYETSLAHLLNTPSGMDTTRYGRVRMWGSVGFIVSVTAFGALLEWAGIAIFPAFVATMNALLLWAAWRLPATRAEARHDEPAPPVLPLLRRPGGGLALCLDRLHGAGAHQPVCLLLAVPGVAGLRQAGRGRAVGGERGGGDRLLLVPGALVPAAHAAPLAAGGGGGHRTALCGHGRVWCLGAGAGAGAVDTRHHLRRHHLACIAEVNRLFPGRLRGRGQALYTTLGYGVPGVLGGVGGGLADLPPGFCRGVLGRGPMWWRGLAGRQPCTASQSGGCQRLSDPAGARGAKNWAVSSAVLIKFLGMPADNESQALSGECEAIVWSPHEVCANPAERRSQP
jgi:PPP family 3-phenylpropionic acid transporter